VHFLLDTVHTRMQGRAKVRERFGKSAGKVGVKMRAKIIVCLPGAAHGSEVQLSPSGENNEIRTVFGAAILIRARCRQFSRGRTWEGNGVWSPIGWSIWQQPSAGPPCWVIGGPPGRDVLLVVES
jgi:hypothetical protein